VLKLANYILDNHVVNITEGLRDEYRRKIQKIINENNIDLICKFINAIRTEANISTNYRRMYICLLSWLSRFHNDKDFKQMTRNDTVAYLDHLRKSEASDPQHK
jgi:hypothetical protein